MVILASSLAEIYLVLNRCLFLYEKNNFLTKISKKILISSIFLLSIFMISPYLFLISLTEVDPVKKLYSFGSTPFSYTTLANVLLISEFLFEHIFLILLLIVLSIIAKIKFRLLLTRGTVNLVTDSAAMTKMEFRFSRMILILTFIFIFTRLTDLMISLPVRLIYLSNFTVSSEFKILINFLRQLVYFIFICAHSFNFIIYFYWDSNLRILLPDR